jgi:hypothetical protein
MNEYPNLFKRVAQSDLEDSEQQEKSSQPLFPSSSSLGLDEKDVKGSVTDVAVALILYEEDKLDNLLRIKAMDITERLFLNRKISTEVFGEIFDLIYEKIKNGTTNKDLYQRPLR